MCFGFEQSDAIIELIDDSKLLIGGRIVGQHEGAVVRPDIGDVAVLSAAELGIIIARLRICWDSRG